jgi:uncharacterized protein YceK
MKTYVLLVLAVFPVVLSGCSTVTRGTTAQLQIESEPSGASVTTSLHHQCTTPCTITVSRKDEFTVIFKREGYKEQSVFVKTILAPAGVAGFAGNVLVGGVVGMGVDAATGATLMHSPDPVKVVLEKAGSAPRVPPRGKQKAAPKASPEPAAEAPAPDAS